MRYDLHLHSHYSDGALPPAALVERVRAAGVDAMALTDHDCTDGIHEAAAAAQAAGLGFIPGVEISTTWNGMTVHIVGLRIRPDDPDLRRNLESLVETRRERARAIAEKLERRRIPGAYEGAAALAGGAVIGRTHFARFLVREGYINGLGNAFKQYLVRGGAAYVPVQWVALKDAVAWIHDAGGQAVVAHPTRYKLSNGKLRSLLADFKSAGGSGIEVVGVGQTRDTTAHCANLAREFGLLASTGSDYHGPDQAWIEPGRFAPLPESCTPIWHDWVI
jgi:predicted metal-dependent phosphoesterase TrpH